MFFDYFRCFSKSFQLRLFSLTDQDVNVPLLEAYQSDKSNYKDVMLMEPYVCGYALPLSALDSILIAVHSTCHKMSNFS